MVKRRKRREPDVSECQYHFCDIKGRLPRCKYCHQTFCTTHLKAKPPGPPRFKGTSTEDILFMQEWHKEGGHPCVPYMNFWEAEHKKQGEDFDRALDRMRQAPIPAPKPFNFKLSDINIFSNKTSSEQPEVTIKYNKIDSEDTGKVLVALILSPFIAIYNFIVALLETLIIRPVKWVFEELRNLLHHTAKGISHILSAVYALAKLLLFFALCYVVITLIINSGIINQIAVAYSNVAVSLSNNSCTPTLRSGQCSPTNKPMYCNNGTMVERTDICGCPDYLRLYNNSCIYKYTCEDGTLAPDCSKNKPYQCVKGNLTENPNVCGCPDDYLIENNTCKKIQRCSDGTIYGQCSVTKPLYCSNGALIQSGLTCGCPAEEVLSGVNCISKYQMNSIDRTFTYTLRGQSGAIPVQVYGGVNDYLSSQSRYVTCSSSGCSDAYVLQTTITRQLDDPLQKKYLVGLADVIRTKASNDDDRARIAISFVQNIPYDWDGFRTGLLNNRYPYEVLYDNKGVCGEKAKLLAFLLRELGYGVVLFDYTAQSHEAVGVKCPTQYSLGGSGYCFVEAATTAIITDNNGDYVGVGKLSTIPTVTAISDGKSFDSVSEEYNDAALFEQLVQAGKNSGGILDSYSYYQWQAIVSKYGLIITQ